MAENKTKKTTTTKKENNNNKKNQQKKVNNKNTKKNTTNNSNNKQKKQQSKTEVKTIKPNKTEPKKTIQKKDKETKEKVINQPIVTKEIEKVIEVEVDKNEESILEKTLIFDGRENQNLAEVVEKLENENIILDDKIIKRSKVKKISVIILTALIFITIIGTIIFIICYEKQREINSQTVNSNIYEKILNNYDNTNDIDTTKKPNHSLINENYKNIEDLSLSQFEQKVLKKENMTVIITSSTCYYCVEFEPVVDEVFKEMNKKIYRINITGMTDKEITKFRTYYAFDYTPTIFTLKKGIVHKDVTGQMTKEELKKWLKENM